MRDIDAALAAQMEISIEHFWLDTNGKEWCFFKLSGMPWLANEDDADDKETE